MTLEEVTVPNILTVTQTAERLGVAIPTVHDWIREGRLPHAYQLSPGRKHSQWRIPEDDVKAIEFMRQKQTETA